MTASLSTARAVDDMEAYQRKTDIYTREWGLPTNPVSTYYDFRYPTDGARMTEEQTVVTAVITSSRGVANVTVTNNGTEVQRQAEPSTPRSLVVTAPIPLREGVNTYNGYVTHSGVAQSQGRQWRELAAVE